jgi:hypothetical protein
VRTERLPILLSCSLPYSSSFQPFVKSGAVSDEMFIGRKSELANILDMNGYSLVYGGRQLGKSALLIRAKNRFHEPKNRRFSFYIDALGLKDEASFAGRLLESLREEGFSFPFGFGAKATIGELCSGLKASQGKQWQRMLVLVDESDSLLEEFSGGERPYSQLDPLIALRKQAHNDFKIVFAGVHNVGRFASAPSAPFGQLGKPLCIKPLSTRDSRELLVRPLEYMGFRLEPEQTDQLLVSANFYPGIIHHVGYEIVSDLMAHYGERYDAGSNPPYALTDRKLGTVVNSSHISDLVNERLGLTLRVDMRYYVLACCVARCCYDEPDLLSDGYMIGKIKENAEYGGLSAEDCERLLPELVEMGILVSPGEGLYKFRQRRFLEALPLENDIDEEICNGSSHL